MALVTATAKHASCDPHTGDHMLKLRNNPQTAALFKKSCRLRDFPSGFFFGAG